MDQSTSCRNTPKILQHTEVNQLNAAKGIELLAAQRWLDRLVAHTYRFSNVLYESILKNERKFKMAVKLTR